MRFIPALWLNRIHNKTQRVLLGKSLGCSIICHGLVKIIVHGMFGVFQNPGGPRDLLKVVQVKHEMHFCKVTSTPAAVPCAFSLGQVNCEREDDFAAAALLYNILCTAIHNLYKSMERGAHSEPADPIHSGGGIKVSFLCTGSG